MAPQYLRIRIPDNIDAHLEDVKKNTGKSKNVQVIIALEEKVEREQPAEVAKPKAKRRVLAAALAAARVDAKKKANRKCDSCGKPAINFSSPLGNPDEPALCDKCFKKLNKQMHEKAGGNR